MLEFLIAPTTSSDDQEAILYKHSYLIEVQAVAVCVRQRPQNCCGGPLHGELASETCTEFSRDHKKPNLGHLNTLTPYYCYYTTVAKAKYHSYTCVRAACSPHSLFFVYRSKIFMMGGTSGQWCVKNKLYQDVGVWCALSSSAEVMSQC